MTLGPLGRAIDIISFSSGNLLGMLGVHDQTMSAPSRTKYYLLIVDVEFFIPLFTFANIESVTSTMNCEDIEEDNERSKLLASNFAVSTLSPLSFPLIKEEIKNEPDYYATEIKLENTYESIVHSSINPDKTSNSPSNGVCEKPGFKEELCFGESAVYVKENKIMGSGQNMTNKNLGFQGNDDELKEATFLNIDSNIYQKDEKKYNCDVYNKSFTVKGNFTIHLPTNNGQILHTCDICGKCFNMKRYLKTHLLIHSERKQYKCDVCAKCFKRKNGLRIHIFTHSEEKPHTCYVCGKVFEMKDALKPHLLTHSGQKSYKCDVCGQCFSRTFNLKTHRLTHNIQKLNKCDVCGMYFKKKNHFKTHLLIHSVQRPHKCEVCGRYFKWKGNYKTHLLTHS
ncbi:unnamed protein product, partial [Timema podura]|nr:unnamed protein product [Timema podura]